MRNTRAVATINQAVSAPLYTLTSANAGNEGTNAATKAVTASSAKGTVRLNENFSIVPLTCVCYSKNIAKTREKVVVNGQAEKQATIYPDKQEKIIFGINARLKKFLFGIYNTNVVFTCAFSQKINNYFTFNKKTMKNFVTIKNSTVKYFLSRIGKI
jgi:hypothetical protein